MTKLFGSIFKVSIKYVYLRGDTYYFQRKIPLDLQPRYGGTKLVKENLGTSDLGLVARKVAALNKHYEATWDAMRGNASITPAQVREAATLLLKQNNLSPQPHTNPEHSVDHFIANVLEPKRLAHAEGDEETYYKAPVSDYLSGVEVAALAMLNEPPKFMLSDALDFYLNMHRKSKDDAFREYNKRIWERFVSIVGDKAFEKLSREDANLFVSKLEGENLKTGTIRRNIRSIAAIYNHGLLEKAIDRTSPFKSVKIGGEGADEEKREPFTAEQLQVLHKACITADDAPRWALAMQMDLGSRIGEVVGLALADIVLDHPVPHVNFEPKPWRTIKNSEKRSVPLVGAALWAAKRVKETATEGQFFAFPRYNPDGITGKTKRDTASATLNKYILGLGVDRTTHELRHTMRDRLRNVNATKQLMDAVGGWGKQDIGDGYGMGYALQTMQEWMFKVCT